MHLPQRRRSSVRLTAAARLAESGHTAVPTLVRQQPLAQRIRQRRTPQLVLVLALMLVFALAACGPVQSESNAGVDPPPVRSRDDLATVQARSFVGRPTSTPNAREAARTATAEARADAGSTGTAGAFSPQRVTPVATPGGSNWGDDMATVPAPAGPAETPVPGNPDDTATQPADGAPQEPTPEEPSEPPLDSTDPLQAGMLALEDLHGGPWTLDDTGGLPYVSVCDAWPLDLIFGYEAAASVAYVSTLSENYQEWVYWTPGIATDVLEYVHEYFGCRLADVYFYDDAMMELSDFPVLLSGDQTFAREFKITHANELYDPLYGHLIVTRVEDAVVALQFIGWEHMDPTLVAQHVERAIERVKTLPVDALPTATVQIY